MRRRRFACFFGIATMLIVGRSFAQDPSPPPSSSPAPSASSSPSTSSSSSPSTPAPERIVVWPTLTPAGDAIAKEPLHKPKPTEGDVFAHAQELDATLRDAMQDFNLDLDVADQGPSPDRMRDLDLIERAARSTKRGASDEGEWVLSARIEPDTAGTFMLRIVCVPPKSKSIRVRVERVRAQDIAVRGLVLVRDLLSVAPPPSPEDRPQIPSPRDSA